MQWLFDPNHELGNGLGNNLDQVAWFRGDYSNNNLLDDKPLNFILHHEPAYGTGAHGQSLPNAMDIKKDKRNKYIELLGQNDVTMIFSGHEHQYTRRRINQDFANLLINNPNAGTSTLSFNPSNREFFEVKTGTCGAQFYTGSITGYLQNLINSPVNNKYHYAVVDVTSTEVRVRVFDSTGTSTPFDDFTVLRQPQTLPPEGCWKFDEGSGTVANDSSGNGNHGTIVGATWTTGDCVSGSQLLFDGNDYVRKASPSVALKPSSQVAISAWIKTTATDTGGSEVVSMGDSYALRVTTDGNIRFFYYNGSTWSNFTTTGVDVRDGECHHIVGQKTGSALQVYVDGVLRGSLNNTGTITYNKGPDFFIGKHGNGDTRYDFIGYIDEVCVYNRALSAQEVLDLFNNPGATNLQAHATFDEGMKTFAHVSAVSGNNGAISGALQTTGISEGALGSDRTNDEINNGISISTGLQAHYAFDEGMENIANDLSGNGNNGTINGAVWITGKIGDALSFNGIDDYVSVPCMNSDEISISAWFYKNEDDMTSADALFSAWRRSLKRQLHEGFELRFHQNTPDRLDFILVSKKGNGIRTRRTATYTFSDSIGNWHHVAGSYNKTTGEQKLYVDGLLVDTKKHPAGNTIVPLTYYPDMRIGYSRVDNGYFNGTLDDVRLYNRTLSDQEVQDLYNH